MKGDYHRYMAEFKVGDERKAAAEDTMAAYKNAQDIAVAELPPTHPIRLVSPLTSPCFTMKYSMPPTKLATWQSRHLRTQLRSWTRWGKNLTRTALFIMQLLRDNLTLWTSDAQDQLDES